MVSLQASWAVANAGILKILWGGGVEAGTLATCWAVEGEESTTKIEGGGPLPEVKVKTLLDVKEMRGAVVGGVVVWTRHPPPRSLCPARV